MVINVGLARCPKCESLRLSVHLSYEHYFTGCEVLCLDCYERISVDGLITDSTPDLVYRAAGMWNDKAVPKIKELVPGVPPITSVQVRV